MSALATARPLFVVEATIVGLLTLAKLVGTLCRGERFDAARQETSKFRQFDDSAVETWCFARVRRQALPAMPDQEFGVSLGVWPIHNSRVPTRNYEGDMAIRVQGHLRFVEMALVMRYSSERFHKSWSTMLRYNASGAVAVRIAASSGASRK